MRLHIAYGKGLDSRCAAAIAKYYGEQKGYRQQLYPMTEDSKAPLLDRITERVYPKSAQQTFSTIAPHDPGKEWILILGISIPAVQFDALEEFGNLTYINFREPFVQTGRHTIRLYDTTDPGKSSCEHTWEALFPDEPMPSCVQLIGRYEMRADKQGGIWYEEILPFQYALHSVETDPGTEDGWSEWSKMFDTLVNSHARKRINEGKVIMRYLHATNKRPSIDEVADA